MKRRSLLALVFAFLVAAAPGLAAGQHAAPREIALSAPPRAVLDGDTFDADLDGSGRVDLPRERVRLLFVDAPELHASPKGQDLRHGIPAKAALAALLTRTPLVLRITPGNEQDTHGRTLARAVAGGEDASLALVRQGHSYFDTRFSFPPDMDEFIAAEADAFDARRGIWREDNSRDRYLERLRKEGRTPESKTNSWFVPDILPAQSLDGKALLGHYIKAQGQVGENRQLSGGNRSLRIMGGGPQPPLSVFVPHGRAKLLGIDRWHIHAMVLVEGFVVSHRERTEVRLNYGRLK